MRKRIYHYEIELIPNFFEVLKVLCKNQKNLTIYHQNINQGKYTYIGLEPKEYIYTENNYLNIYNKTQFMNKKGDYLKHLLDWVYKTDVYAKDHLPPFIGGAMGFISDTLYDYYQKKEVKSQMPHICFMVFDEIIVLDHERKKLIFIFVGEYDYDYYFNNRFKTWKDKLSKMLKEESTDDKYFDFNLEEDDLKSRYNEILNKFNKEYFTIKVTEKIDIESNYSMYEIFLSLIDNKIGTQCVLFKTTDFIIINANHNNYLKKDTEGIQINFQEDMLFNIQNDIFINQTLKLDNVEIMNESTGISLSLNNIDTYHILKELSCLDSDYGVPFDRLHSYLRRSELSHRFKGLIGVLSYNKQFIFSSIKDPIIKNDQEFYISMESTIHNLSKESDYLNSIYTKIDLALEKFVL